MSERHPLIAVGLEIWVLANACAALNNNILPGKTKMTGVAIDASSIYSDLKDSQSATVCRAHTVSQNYAERKEN